MSNTYYPYFPPMNAREREGGGCIMPSATHPTLYVNCFNFTYMKKEKKNYLMKTLLVEKLTRRLLKSTHLDIRGLKLVSRPAGKGGNWRADKKSCLDRYCPAYTTPPAPPPSGSGLTSSQDCGSGSLSTY